MQKNDGTFLHIMSLTWDGVVKFSRQVFFKFTFLDFLFKK